MTKTAPYGYILILRAIARVAIVEGENGGAGAMLRVFCVLAEYADQKGECRVGQDTIAARLGISRQAVNRQVKNLADLDLVFVGNRKGKPSLYAIDLEGLDEDRHNIDAVTRRRYARAMERKGYVRKHDQKPELRYEKVSDEGLFGWFKAIGPRF